MPGNKGSSKCQQRPVVRQPEKQVAYQCALDNLYAKLVRQAQVPEKLHEEFASDILDVIYRTLQEEGFQERRQAFEALVRKKLDLGDEPINNLQARITEMFNKDFGKQLLDMEIELLERTAQEIKGQINDCEEARKAGQDVEAELRNHKADLAATEKRIKELKFDRPSWSPETIYWWLVDGRRPRRSYALTFIKTYVDPKERKEWMKLFGFQGDVQWTNPDVETRELRSAKLTKWAKNRNIMNRQELAEMANVNIETLNNLVSGYFVAAPTLRRIAVVLCADQQEIDALYHFCGYETLKGNCGDQIVRKIVEKDYFQSFLDTGVKNGQSKGAMAVEFWDTLTGILGMGYMTENFQEIIRLFPRFHVEKFNVASDF